VTGTREGTVLFETPRLIGRRLQSDDLNALIRVYGDADAMRWVGDGEPLDERECARWLEVTAANYRLRGYGMSALVARDSSRVIGFCGLVHPNGQEQPEIKYALEREHWGQGLATEAARAMLAYGAAAHGLRSVIATTDPDNKASHRVLEKAGMNVAGLHQHDDGGRTLMFCWGADASAP
jgi:RimJ/RimL family protein N-acetyltransferase